jgi:ABC-type sugar transport system ATPase subunit
MEAEIGGSKPLLDLRGIGKSFPGVDALVDVDFAAKSGEVHALVGANGAGKSTLIGLLSGIYPPSTGTIRLSGREVTFRSPREARQAGISTVYQELTVLPNLSVAENVFLGREPRFGLGVVHVSRLKAEARELFERYGLALDPQATTGRLSIGQRQIVELARALSTASQVLILDELTASLSTAEQTMLFGIVNRLKRAGLLILYVSHRLEEVFALADRVTVLRDGRRVTTQAVSALSQRELIHLIVGHNVSERFDLPHVAAGAPLLEATLATAAGSKEFAVRAGEIVGLAGVLGSGRTRLARSLAGLEPRARAVARVCGKDVAPSSPKAAISHGIVYLTEDRKADGLFSNLSVLANATAGALGEFTRSGMIRMKYEKRTASEMLERVQLVARSLDAPVRVLSGGNQQKTLFARALLCRPRVLICDEPTRGVDVGAREQIYQILLDLARRGIAIIVISSEHKELLAICHRLLVVRDGSVYEELEPSVSEHELAMIAAGFSREEAWTTSQTSTS